ncbi:MAG: DUF3494 domain-containing protein [Crocinitomicaceae bacterium]|nr:DUF3494 domain-containing protein [Crocinitomicaceae bacterium]
MKNLTKTFGAFISLLLLTGILISGCKKDENNNPDNPDDIPQQTSSPNNADLGVTIDFAIIAGSAVTSTGNTKITGDIGLSPGSSVGGFPPAILNGTMHISDPVASSAKLDLTSVYDDLAGRTSTEIVTLSGNIGGLTLTPGLYKSTSTLSISSGDLTLDALGDENGVFIIQIASSFTTTSGRKVILSGGAKAANVYWQVGTSATIGTTSNMKGNIIAMQSITFKTGATLNGRAFARSGAVTLEESIITAP